MKSDLYWGIGTARSALATPTHLFRFAILARAKGKLHTPSQAEADRLSSELLDTISQAGDERPLQAFFEANPSMLVQLFGYGGARWVFPPPRLGSEHIPDFAVCGLNSAGPHWHLIELESPTVAVLDSFRLQFIDFAVNIWFISYRRGPGSISFDQSENLASLHPSRRWKLPLIGTPDKICYQEIARTNRTWQNAPLRVG